MKARRADQGGSGDSSDPRRGLPPDALVPTGNRPNEASDGVRPALVAGRREVRGTLGLEMDENWEVVEDDGVVGGRVGFEGVDDGKPRCRYGLRVRMVGRFSGYSPQLVSYQAWYGPARLFRC